MKEFIEFIAKHLVDNPDNVEVEEKEAQIKKELKRRIEKFLDEYHLRYEEHDGFLLVSKRTGKVDTFLPVPNTSARARLKDPRRNTGSPQRPLNWLKNWQSL